MKNIRVVVVFIVIVGLICAGALYANALYHNGYFQPKERLDRIALGADSQWFSSIGGFSCATSFGCKKNGARLHGVYLNQGHMRFRLQHYYPEIDRDYMDLDGNTPKGTKFVGCEGGDAGIIFSLEQQKEYEPDIEIAELYVGADEDLNVDEYEYILPKGYDRMKDGEVTLVFEATQYGMKQVYEQNSLIKGCLK